MQSARLRRAPRPRRAGKPASGPAPERSCRSNASPSRNAWTPAGVMRCGINWSFGRRLVGISAPRIQQLPQGGTEGAPLCNMPPAMNAATRGSHAPCGVWRDCGCGSMREPFLGPFMVGRLHMSVPSVARSDKNCPPLCNSARWHKAFRRRSLGPSPQRLTRPPMACTDSPARHLWPASLHSVSLWPASTVALYGPPTRYTGQPSSPIVGRTVRPCASAASRSVLAL